MIRNKAYFLESQKGVRVDNLPDKGVQTGFYFYDFYGCWWEYVTDAEKDHRWLIGFYPDDTSNEEEL